MGAPGRTSPRSGACPLEIVAAVGAPAAKRSLPCCSSFSAASGFTATSAPVRTPCMPWSAAAPLDMEGGPAAGSSQNSHTACLQIVDATVDLDLTASHSLTDGLTVAQQKVHGVEDVHLDRVGRDGIGVRARTHFLLGLVLQKPLQRRASFLEGDPGHPETSLWPHRQHRTLCGLGPAPSGCPNCPCRTPSCQRCCPSCLSCLQCFIVVLLQTDTPSTATGPKTCQSCVRAGSVQVLPALRSTKMSPRARAQDRVARRFKVGVMQDASYWERSNSELLVLVRTCSHRTPMLTLALHSKMCESCTWHGVEDSLQGGARVRAANDRRVRGLALRHQLLANH